MHYKAFVSSTYEDLKMHRAHVINALQQAGFFVDPMEVWTADSDEPKAFSQQRVADCQLCIVLVARRRGFVPAGETLSITQLEYQYAVSHHIDVLPFLLDNEALWFAKHDERHSDPLVDGWRNELRNRHGAPLFNHEPDSIDISAALTRWIAKQPPSNGDVPRRTAPAAVIPHQLPPPPHDFTGRERDLESIRQKVGEGLRVIGLRGMGGLGKSTLAAMAAEILATDYPDGQLHLDLKGTDPSQVAVPDAMRRMIRAFGSDQNLPEDPEELSGTYRSILSGKKVLLFLDNAADAAQVDPLLPPGQSLVIFTSRQRFHVPGLFSIDLHDLGSEAACELLIRSAPAVVDLPQYAAEIARRLWYLPLALRLAASALDRPDISAEQYLTRLKEKGALKLSDGIDAAIAMSVDLLDSSAKRRFAMLSVFDGGWTVAAAQAVWDVPEDEADRVVLDLLRHSLLEWNSMQRLYRLHDLVRESARIRCSPDDAALACLRHATYFDSEFGKIDAMYRNGGVQSLEALDRFERALPNLRSAFEWTKKLTDDDNAAAKLCNSIVRQGWLVLECRKEPRRYDWVEAGLAAARKLGDSRSIAIHLRRLAWKVVLSEPKKALEFFDEALRISRELADREGEAIVLRQIGIAHEANRNSDRAIECFQSSLNIARDPHVTNRRIEINALGSLGNAYFRRGDLKKAVEYLEQSIELNPTQDLDSVLYDSIPLAHIYLAQNQYQKAEVCCDRLLTVQRKLRMKEFDARILELITSLGKAVGKFSATCRAHLEYLRDEAVRSEDLTRAVQIMTLLIESDQRNSDSPDDTVASIKDVFELVQKIEPETARMENLNSIGLQMCHLSAWRASIDFLQPAAELACQLGRKRAEGNAWGNLGCAFTALGEFDKAIEAHQHALAIDRELGDKAGEMQGSWDLGETYERKRDFARAAELMQLRVDYLSTLNDPQAGELKSRIDALRGRVN
ncbi:MAG: tetratricopeptide repeat protein [Planctomycetaceae bacterium]